MIDMDKMVEVVARAIRGKDYLDYNQANKDARAAIKAFCKELPEPYMSDSQCTPQDEKISIRNSSAYSRYQTLLEYGKDA